MEGNPTPHAVAAECRLHLSVCTLLVLTFGSQGVGLSPLLPYEDTAGQCHLKIMPLLASVLPDIQSHGFGVPLVARSRTVRCFVTTAPRVAFLPLTQQEDQLTPPWVALRGSSGVCLPNPLQLPPGSPPQELPSQSTQVEGGLCDISTASWF